MNRINLSSRGGYGAERLKPNDFIRRHYDGITVEISSKDHGWGSLVDCFRDMKQRYMVSNVGILAESKKRSSRKRSGEKRRSGEKDRMRDKEAQAAKKSASSSANIATYAFYNEFGTPTAPSRPWMRNTFDKNVNGYVKYIENELGRFFFRKKPRKIMENLSKKVVRQMRNAVDTWNSPPNAASTVKRKGRNAPLRETYAMRNAIKWKWER